MASFGDPDGKSKTAAAIDAQTYPPIDKTAHQPPVAAPPPSEEEIAARAHQLWLQQGCPENAAEDNWLEAEREMQAAALSRRLTQMTQEKGGSAQN